MPTSSGVKSGILKLILIIEVASLSLFTEAVSTAFVMHDCCNFGGGKEWKKNTGFTSVKVIYSARNA